MNYPAQPPQGMNSFPLPRPSQAAQRVAREGRGDDSTLVHVSPAEVRGLAAMAPGGRLPINPKTGLPEAGLLSTILGIVGTIGGSFIGAPELGPALAGAIGGGLGTFGGGLLEGKDFGSALGMGLMGGLTSYGLGSAAGMLGSAGAGDAAHEAAEELVKNGVQPAALADFAPATSQVTNAAADTGGGLFGGFDGSEAAAGLNAGNAATAADPYLSGALNSPSLGGVSQFAGNPTIVDPATGVAQNFSPTNQIITSAKNIGRGLTSPTALYDTFVNHASSTLLPAAVGYYGSGYFDTPQQQGTSIPTAQADNTAMPTLPGPNKRKYIPAPSDWDYSTGKTWNYWTPAFADGGVVSPIFDDMDVGTLRMMATGRYKSARHLQDLAQQQWDSDYANYSDSQKRQADHVANQIDNWDGQMSTDTANYPMYARGGLVDTYGSGRAFGRPVTMRPMAREGLAKPVPTLQRQPPVQMHQMLSRGMAGGGPVSGPGGGLDDAIPAVINGRQPAALSSGEYVVPAHAVSALGDGSSEAGSAKLDQMVQGVMQAKYGTRHPAPISGRPRMRGAHVTRPFAEGGAVTDGSDDMTNQYNTLLSPEEERAYQQEYSPEDSYDYDMRGAFTRGIAPGENGHYPDTFKKPNHPTFSDQSQYHGKDGYYGGSWQKMGDGWQFVPGPANLAIHGMNGLQRYMRAQDPTVTVVPPPVQGLAAFADGGEVDSTFSPGTEMSSNVEDRTVNPLLEVNAATDWFRNSARDYLAPYTSPYAPTDQDIAESLQRENMRQARAAFAESLLNPSTEDAEIDRMAARNFSKNLEFNNMVRDVQNHLRRRDGYARGGLV